MKKILLVVFLTLAAANAHASSTQDAAGCGVGTEIFKEKHGLAYNLLATTTNGMLFGTVSQTFGLVNCPSDTSISGKVASFIEFNKQQLAVEASQGHGDRLAALVDMYGVKEANRAAAMSALKSNHEVIFRSASTAEIQAEMSRTLQAYLS